MATRIDSKPDVALTSQEAKIVGLLAEVWNEYMKLPLEHPMG